MGVLSDPKQRQKIIKAVTKYNKLLCVILYLGGVFGFLALAFEPFHAGTYFSENALLPGLVENEFRLDSEARSYNEELHKEIKKSDKTLPKDWMFKQFQNLGLDTYYHNFSLHYPFGMPRDKAIPGQNIYSILRAKRASSTEAVVMSVPLRHPGVMPNEQTSGGIAVMLALAKHFRKQTYWAKDIVFVLTEFDEIGMQAWLDGYHQTKSDYIISEDLPGRSGPIQAAINLEIPGEAVTSYNIKLEGLNGQLPNLDLCNLVVRLCRKERAKVTLNKQVDSYERESWDSYKQSVTTMMYMMWNQASGTPTGNHGLFHRYHIEALTIQGTQEEKPYKTLGVEQTSRLVEGIFRSLNNLLERFHQSFFFYILPSTRGYISIGLYMPPFGAMIAACLIKISLFQAIALWISRYEEEEEDKETEDKQSDDESQKVTDAVSGIVSIIPVIAISMLMASLAYTGPKLLTNVSHPFRLRPEDSLMFGLLALFCASVAFPKMFNKKKPDHAVLHLDWKLLKCIALIVQSLTLFSIALMNISLAFFIGVAMVPVTTLIVPTTSRSLLLLLLVSPASLVFISSIIAAWLDQHNDISQLLYMTWGNMKHCIFMKLLDLYLFGNWTYTVMSFVIFPCWLLFWAIPNCNTDIDV
ncbi:hypothetical protein LOTGIDRAFT_191474 [Lottia gigantea]|uniref:GPI-anchor transamidase component GPAA1 n=1 Tax=Lottia gigantea TaxID=225164 RepID=V3ZI91_LOTGI|nr:hypothetical protein LOTGIDRAFT_191474 [Lottia gigantea]ESO90988.1 hypothetical protein LOTGIDRAFT_191474 [Lottia gigantea]